MKNYIFLLLILPAISIAESKMEVAQDIVLEDESIKNEILALENILDEQRDAVIETSDPIYDMEGVPPEILSMEEQLYLDVTSSNLFIIDREDFENAIASDLANFLTKEELIELREIYRRPIFKKLSSINESVMKSSQEFTQEWQKGNSSLLEEFMDRFKELSDKKLQYINDKDEAH